jgi:hypothetical protein
VIGLGMAMHYFFFLKLSVHDLVLIHVSLCIFCSGLLYHGFLTYCISCVILFYVFIVLIFMLSKFKFLYIDSSISYTSKQY